MDGRLAEFGWLRMIQRLASAHWTEVGASGSTSLNGTGPVVQVFFTGWTHGRSESGLWFRGSIEGGGECPDLWEPCP